MRGPFLQRSTIAPVRARTQHCGGGQLRMVPPSADDAAINQIVETTRESPEACRQAFFECNKNVEEAIFFLVTSAPHCLATLTARGRSPLTPLRRPQIRSPR